MKVTNSIAWLEMMNKIEEEDELIAAQEEFEANQEKKLKVSEEEIEEQHQHEVGKSILDYFSEDSTYSYDGYRSDPDDREIYGNLW